ALPVEVDLALVHRMDPGNALDQRRLAGAVVADERHHLSGSGFEVDVHECLYRPEGLRHSAQLEQGSVGHGELFTSGLRWGRRFGAPTFVLGARLAVLRVLAVADV